MSKYWMNYPQIAEQLELVQAIIIKTNRSSEAYLNESIDYLMTTGGKMIRPAFLMIGSMLGDENIRNKQKIATLAAAVETLHLATLIHDDIIDESKLRRGNETIQSKYSKEYAVYMGDYLFSQCFVMLAEENVSAKVLHQISKGVARICKGEMLQSHLRYTTNVNVLDYLRIIKGKTAALFAVSLGAGAFEAKVPEKISRKIGMIGLNIGMAFQLVDDLLDYTGVTEQTGKEVQADIIKGYYTLPLIYTLNSEFGEETKSILSQPSINGEQIGRLIELAHLSGAIHQTQALAQKYTKKAINGLMELPSSQGRTILLDIVPKMLSRIY